MIEFMPKAVRNVEVEAWKDQILIAVLYFGGVIIISSFAVIMGLIWSLIH